MKVSVILGAYLERKGAFKDRCEKEKAQYILATILNEATRFCIIAVAFALFGKIREFAVSFWAVMLTRTFAGGIHEERKMGCILHSFAFFLAVLGLSELPIDERIEFFLEIIVPLMVMALFALYAPLHSVNKRGKFSRKKTIILRIMSLAGIFICVLWMAFSPGVRRVVTFTLFIEMVEYIVLLKNKNKQKGCEEKCGE